MLHEAQLRTELLPHRVTATPKTLGSFFASSFLSLQATNGIISGTAADSETGAVLPGVIATVQRHWRKEHKYRFHPVKIYEIANVWTQIVAIIER